MMKRATAALILTGTLSFSSPTAREEFANLNQQAHSARQSGDKEEYLRAALQMQELLHHAPSAVKAAARAYAAAGDTKHALAALNQLADLGQADETLLNGKDSSFFALSSLPEYKSILEHFARNNAAISLGKFAFTLSEPGILAEDITYDSQSKSFLITSVLEKKIIRVTSDGVATDFAQSPSHWPLLAIKADSARNVVWATEVALDGFTVVPKPDWGRSAVLSFNLKTGALLSRIEGPAHSALGDMVLTQTGEPIVSDGVEGGLYRVTGGHLKLLNNHDFISPQTPAMLPDGDHALVPDYLRGIGILDLKNEHMTWLNLDLEAKNALSGVDGLYFDHGSLILTQNGTSPERVIRLQLDKTYSRIISSQIIEQATPTLGDPTHGVIVGDSFYYIANSGWDKLDEHGGVNPGSTLSPALIMRFRLR